MDEVDIVYQLTSAALLILVVLTVMERFRRHTPIRKSARAKATVYVLILFVLESIGITQIGKDTRWVDEVQCRGQLSVLAGAMSMYADTSGGRFPVDADPPTLVGCMQLLSNVPNADTKVLRFLCPRDRRGGKAASSFQTLTRNNISYSYVPNLLKNTNEPARIILLDRINSTSAGSIWPVNGNHGRRGGNVAYTDGRVEFFSKLPEALQDSKGRPVV